MTDGLELPAVLDRRTQVPDNYDPVRGLNSVAVAKAAEERFARAKDYEMLFEAVNVKLAEQRRFVLWWDGLGDKRGRPEKTSQTADVFPTLESLGMDGDTVYRWRKRLRDSKRYDLALEAVQERCRRICEMEKGSTEQKGASGTGENEWYTPGKYLDLARQVLGEIDLDPASSDKAQEAVQAKQYFTVNDNGLTHEWHGRVWLNPPYAQPHIAEFVSKMVAERCAERVTSAIMLTHNYTDTSWFHEASEIADAICFTRGRVKFVDKDGNECAPTQGQAFFYFGDDVATFAATFLSVGFIVTPFTGEVQ